MIDVSAQTTLELWASELRKAKARIRPLFAQQRVATSAGLFLEMLLNSKWRKTGTMRALAAGDSGPWRQQALLNRDRWEADALRDIVRAYALEALADPEGVLVIDEAGFLKQGRSSCGVARQHAGPAGRAANCQVGVFLAYASQHGHALIDRALYLPKSWTDDADRLRKAHVPSGVGFATRPQMALRMIERATAAGVPFAWVAADDSYAAGAFETVLRHADKGYVIGVNADSQFSPWAGKPGVAGSAEAIAKGLDASAWRRLSTGVGTRGAQPCDWAYLELADLKTDERRGKSLGLWTRGLLIRRDIANGKQAYFSTWCPARTRVETLAAVEGRRRTVRDSLEIAKAELGLDHNASRSWHGWHRHVSLVMLAFAALATVHRRASQAISPKAPPHALHTGGSGPHTPLPARPGGVPSRPQRGAHT